MARKAVIRKQRVDGVKQRYHVTINTSQPKNAVNIKKEKTIAEPKYDGTRTVAFVKGNNVDFYNRRSFYKNNQYPDLMDIAKNVKGTVTLDGEVVVLDKKNPYGNFQKLAFRDNLKDPERIRRRARKYPLTYVVFDVLEKDGKDITDMPLIERKKILDNIIKQTDNLKEIKFTNKPEDLLKQIKNANGEGIIMKDINSKYKGGRNNEWEKIKLKKEADVTITGITPGKGKRKGFFGALNMAVNSPEGFKDVGNVGTGFKDKDLKQISKKLQEGEKLVARVKYQRVGSQGRLIGPSFIAIRNDISPKQTHL